VPARVDHVKREAARREAVTALRIAETTAGYAAAQIADGLDAGRARAAVADAAAELEAVAALLRRLAWPVGPDPAERRAAAVELAGRGLSPREIAERLAVRRHTVARYLAARRTLAALGLGQHDDAPADEPAHESLGAEHVDGPLGGYPRYAVFLGERAQTREHRPRLDLAACDLAA
jgi:hypothetical protein